MQQPYWKVEQTDLSYGLGFAVHDVGNRRLIGHGGSFPGFSTRTMFDPKDRLVIVVLTNEIGDTAEPLARAVVRILDYALAQQPAAHAAAPSLNDRFAGRFVSREFVVDLAAFGEILVGLLPDANDPLPPIITLAVEDSDTLRITAANGLLGKGETVRYTRDDTGRVVKAVMVGLSAYPLDIYCAEYAAKALTDPASSTSR